MQEPVSHVRTDQQTTVLSLFRFTRFLIIEGDSSLRLLARPLDLVVVLVYFIAVE